MHELTTTSNKLKSSKKKATSVAAHTLRGFCRTPRVHQVAARVEEDMVAGGQCTAAAARRGVESTEAQR
jgi:hypothetical protein